MKRFKSLKKKLIVCIVGIIFVTSVLNLAVGIYASYKGITKNVESDLKSIGQTANIAIDTSLNNMKLNIRSVAESSEIGKSGVSPSDLLKMLDTKKQQMGYQTLSLVNGSGTIFSDDASLNGKNIADQEYFKKALSGETYLSGTTYDINKKLCVIACAPVSNDNDYQGIVMATLDPQVYSSIIKNIVIGTTGNVFITDKEGTLIANIRPALVESRTNFIQMAKTDSTYATAAVVYQHMAQGKSGVEVYSYETGDRICYYAPIKDTDGWAFGVVAPIVEMTSPIWLSVFGLGLASLLCIVLGVILSTVLSRSIANPILTVCDRLKLLSAGDLHTDTVEVKARDETAVLASSLNKTVLGLRGYIEEISHVLHEVAYGNMCVQAQKNFEGDFIPIQKSLAFIIEALNGILSEINGSSDQIASGSQQVSAGAQALAQGSSEQAGSIEELSKTIAEISNHVKQNARDAAEASGNMGRVRSEIEASNGHMGEMVSAMDRISESSNQIGKIIKTIQNIAFQTNILALNAAVEAARAGDAGKGFAVVADEVRNLAGKSSEAAKDTTVLIENTMHLVEEGSKIANQTAESLSAVVESIQTVSERVDSISGATLQQSDAVGQVSSGVTQISDVVQTNSATAEESAAASEELSGQAQVLKSLVGKFQLNIQSGEGQGA
ncbi:methyl-accepting chemotaxis protein [Caproiciproducens sp. NJN-50]|uniref:methyl-accepting chemotaxis protein n=1 Tax=Caproiciproducens sp. NJN-50 TaxID=2507162 RepID=UPI001FAAC6C9|nr:methyl-accepting chemotaxis protein [Caproiciproducens sp. NJN-50]